ncbi:MAG: glycerophosphodiester phosphodiesterase [Clostridiaceae bacterium]|jgi:glycerophosphoryl diester phosphodiesterase|nr:glycerophosphodiester phosphodiesterase [Clostridiaceae bacterium]
MYFSREAITILLKNFLSKLNENLCLKSLFKKFRNFSKINIAMVVCIIVPFLLILLSSSVNEALAMKKVVVIAHRGYSKAAPENSVSSIDRAIKAKSDYAEIDVQETKDGIVVLSHDRGLNRTAGVNSLVSQLNYSEISKLDIGLKFSKSYKNERIPTLKQILKESKGKIKLIIELKTYNKNYEKLTADVVDQIEKNNMVNNCSIHSVNYNSLLLVKRINRKIRTGYIVLKHVNDLSSYNVDFYSIDKSLVTEKVLNDMHKINRQVYVWTVNSQYEKTKFINLGADGIITDNPTK